jgi:hypothetical protein
MSKSPEELRLECLSMAVSLFGPDTVDAEILATAARFADFVLAPAAPAPKAKPALKKEPARKVEPTPKPAAKPTDDPDPEDAGRDDKIAALVKDLSADHRIVMKALLGRVETKHLDGAYRQYLPRVVNS